MIVYNSKLSIDHEIFGKNKNLRKIRQAFKGHFLIKFINYYTYIHFLIF